MWRHVPEFLAVAQCGSFTTAAKMLGVSIPHVSRSVKALEEELGVKLFSRTTRLVRLTTAGELLQTEFESAFEDIELALDRVRVETKALSGRIRLACITGSFADEVIAPALADFANLHPDLEFDIDFNPGRVDLIRQGYDIAIRAGRTESKNLHSIELINRERAAAASPAYIERFGAPDHPSDLSNHQCIRTFSNLWSFSINNRTREIEVSGRLQMNSGEAIRLACEAGLGIAYMAKRGFKESLELGRLLPILQDYWMPHAPISIVYPRTEHTSARIGALVEHLTTTSRAQLKTATLG